MAFPHITVDEVVERLDDDRRSPALRVLLAVAVAVVAVLDSSAPGSGALALLWVPIAALPAFLRARDGAAAVVAASAVVGVLGMPADSSVSALVVEAAGRATVLGAVVAAAAWVAGATRELAHRSRLDGATGLLNRTGFANALERERQRSLRSRTPLSLVYFDLDGLKAANDRLGHAAGDVLLAEFARRLHACRRTIDVAGRVGGDEFVLLLPATDADGTSQLLDRLFREASASGSCPKVSAGAISWTVPPPAEEMLRAADEAMYVVKRAGGGSWTLIDVGAPARPPVERRHRRRTPLAR